MAITELGLVIMKQVVNFLVHGIIFAFLTYFMVRAIKLYDENVMSGYLLIVGITLAMCSIIFSMLEVHFFMFLWFSITSVIILIISSLMLEYEIYQTKKEHDKKFIKGLSSIIKAQDDLIVMYKEQIKNYEEVTSHFRNKKYHSSRDNISPKSNTPAATIHPVKKIPMNKAQFKQIIRQSVENGMTGKEIRLVALKMGYRTSLSTIYTYKRQAEKDIEQEQLEKVRRRVKNG